MASQHNRHLHIGIDASRAQVKKKSGTENYSFQLIRALLHLGSAHEFTLYLREPLENPFRQSPRMKARIIGPGRLWTHIGLSYEMTHRPPDVLFVPAHVLPLRRPRRSVVTVHDLGYLYYPSAHKRVDRWYLHLSTAYHVRVATRLVADSFATKKDLIEKYGADPAKIAVVHLAAGEAFHTAIALSSIAAARTRYARGEPYLLFLGTVQPRKNVAGLLQAYGHLRHQLPDPPALVIAGRRGWLSDPIYRLTEQLGLRERIHFVDYVPDDDLPALLSGALALVMPSFYEGFGLPALEAMACGTPVIASNCSSLPEVVGDASILVDPHDVGAIGLALRRIVSDLELRAELRNKGLERAAQFSWDRCARETLRVLEEAAG